MTPSDLDLDELARITYSAVFSDVCDQLGLRHQTLAPNIAPVVGLPEGATLIGWARTARSIAVDAPPERHYGAEIDFIDSLAAGDLVIADCSEAPAAFWGELFSTAAAARGARGAVVDGLIRDHDRIARLGFPVFATGHRPTDSLGRVSIDVVDVPISVGGVTVASSDLIVADHDGVVVVPASCARAVADRAAAKASTESDAQRMLRSGAMLREAWERFRVL